MVERLLSLLIVPVLLSYVAISSVGGATNDFAPGSAPPRSNYTWTLRVISEKEIENLFKKDKDLSVSASLRILAKLNARDFDYIQQDINEGKPIRVPNDFTSFKSWTPLEKFIPGVADIPKFILIVKDLPYIGWYEKGRLVGDTYICVGKAESTTDEGLYTVQEKDVEHVSKSYQNTFGEPAPMPWALKIYGTVWIHAGDIAGGYCSHGCINLPIFPAMSLFEWTDPGTPVLITDSLRTIPTVLAQNRSNCALHASACNPNQKAVFPAGKQTSGDNARHVTGSVSNPGDIL